MAEYINRDEFIKSQCHSCDGYCDVIECDCLNCKHECRCDTIADLLDYPAADVEEKRTGKWVKVSYVERSAFGRAIWHKTFQCSRCGGLFGREDDKYCYNCGAYMRGESDG